MPVATRKKHTLDNSGFIELLDKELERFSDDSFPLSDKQLQAIRRCTNLVNTDKSDIGDNAPKRRARGILIDLWTHIPEVFFLCSLATTPTLLGTLKSEDYLKFVSQWWKNVDVPSGLTKTLECHKHALPAVSRDQRQVTVDVSFGALLEFLQRNFSQQRVELCLPFSGNPLPFARLGEQAKIEFSWEWVNLFTREYQAEVRYSDVL